MTFVRSGPLNLDRLLELRLVVARFGEMDVARWWNTTAMLGTHGAAVLRRGFPATHYFAQARVVFAVARSRCQELFDPPECVTLWDLPAGVEDAFEDHWQTCLDDRDRWVSTFESLAELQSEDLADVMYRLELLSADQREVVKRLRRSAEGRAVPLPGTHSLNDDLVTLLAAGFSRGEAGSPAIPYAKLEG